MDSILLRKGTPIDAFGDGHRGKNAWILSDGAFTEKQRQP